MQKMEQVNVQHVGRALSPNLKVVFSLYMSGQLWIDFNVLFVNALYVHSFLTPSAFEFIIKECDSQNVNNDNTKSNFEVKSLAGGRQR